MHDWRGGHCYGYPYCDGEPSYGDPYWDDPYYYYDGNEGVFRPGSFTAQHGSFAANSPAPEIEPASYRLQIDRAVRSLLSLTYKELRDMPAETRVAILECAGKSRGVCLEPKLFSGKY